MQNRDIESEGNQEEQKTSIQLTLSIELVHLVRIDIH